MNFNGEATKFVVVVSQWPDKETEKLLNMIHVEELPATVPA
jgi:hypothetical protein